MNMRGMLNELRTEVPMITLNRVNYKHGFGMPMIAHPEGNYQFLNSGGRGILIERPNESYRLKGIDPLGIATFIVGNSPRNYIGDIRKVLKSIPLDAQIETKNNNIVVWDYRYGSPFGVLTKESAERAVDANSDISNFYYEHKFNPPCVPVNNYEMEGICYRNKTGKLEKAHCVLFRIPGVESDIRHMEYLFALRAGLTSAASEEVRAVKDKVLELYLDMSRWNGFSNRAMYEKRLLPHENSFYDQNYTISRVSDEGFGIGRVDHGSTKSDVPTEKLKVLKNPKNIGFFNGMPTAMLLGIYLQDEGKVFDPDIYISYFDWGYRYGFEKVGFYGKAEIPVSKELEDYLHAIDESFKDGFKGNVKPITEERFTELPLIFGAKGYFSILPPQERKIVQQITGQSF